MATPDVALLAGKLEFRRAINMDPILRFRLNRIMQENEDMCPVQRCSTSREIWQWI